MKNSLLLAGALFFACGSISATTNYYPASSEITGDGISVSGNGRYAVITDQEMSQGYLWDSENPTEYVPVTSAIYNKVNILGVSDDCRMVGQVYLPGGKWRPAYRDGLDGEWIELEVHPLTHNVAEAKCISNDGKYIAGYAMIMAGENGDGPVKGAFYPVQWTLNDDGEYDFKAFIDFDVLGQQGFLTYCQSNDGRVIGGFIHAGCSDAFLPAMVLDGKFVMFDEVVYKEEPWYYKDQIMGYSEVSYINGFKDDQSNYTFSGAFNGVDNYGNLYGARTIVTDVTPEGGGILHNYAAVYNYLTDTWTYNDQYRAFSTGLDNKVIFANGAGMILNGKSENIEEGLDFHASQTLTAVMDMSDDTKVLGGLYEYFNEDMGMFYYYPFVITLDEPLVEISGVELVGDNKETAIILSQGRIDITGAEEGIVYDLNGRLVGSGKTIVVAPGTYVVKAGRESRTVLIK